MFDFGDAIVAEQEESAAERAYPLAVEVIDSDAGARCRLHQIIGQVGAVVARHLDATNLAVAGILLRIVEGGEGVVDDERTDAGEQPDGTVLVFGNVEEVVDVGVLVVVLIDEDAEIGALVVGEIGWSRMVVVHRHLAALVGIIAEEPLQPIAVVTGPEDAMNVGDGRKAGDGVAPPFPIIERKAAQWIVGEGAAYPDISGAIGIDSRDATGGLVGIFLGRTLGIPFHQVVSSEEEEAALQGADEVAVGHIWVGSESRDALKDV